MPKGWRDWFRRVLEKNGGDWEVYDLNQCLTLSLSGMERNDALLISTSYFWSNTLNAFIFFKLITTGFQKMRNKILIPSTVVPNAYYLGPMGDPDPSDFINQETN